MPNISTHINFLRILKNKQFNKFDINYLTLGNIAPDYYLIFNDSINDSIAHFRENTNDKSDLISYKLYLTNKRLNYLEKSFAIGYYIHLWLDNYFYDNKQKLSIDEYNIGEFGSNIIINENIKNYDIKFIIEFVSEINIIESALRDILPIKINKAIKVWDDFKYKCLNKNFNIICPMLLSEYDYSKFMDECTDKFLKEHTLFQNI